MASPQPKLYTEEDYYSLPENVRAELINGQFYYMAAPGRIHQKILNYLNTQINIYIRSKNGPCEVYPAPFAVIEPIHGGKGKRILDCRSLQRKGSCIPPGSREFWMQNVFIPGQHKSQHL